MFPKQTLTEKICILFKISENCNDCGSCNDTSKNGDEEGIDCGGSFCKPCRTTSMTTTATALTSDCSCPTTICPNLATEALTMTYSTTKAPSTATIPTLETCYDNIQNNNEEGKDCGGPNCNPCPTCNDMEQNGNETDIDCGGPDCEPCATCWDNIKNRDEEEIDCGGTYCSVCRKYKLSF